MKEPLHISRAALALDEFELVFKALTVAPSPFIFLNDKVMQL